LTDIASRQTPHFDIAAIFFCDRLLRRCFQDQYCTRAAAAASGDVFASGFATRRTRIAYLAGLLPFDITGSFDFHIAQLRESHARTSSIYHFK
jgi:hypothetical protein